MTERDRSSTPTPTRRPRRTLLVLATVLGVGIGPAVAAGAAIGGAAPPVLAAALMTLLSATGLAGLAVSVHRWITSSRRPSEAPGGSASDGAFRFALRGQRTSLALASIVLLIIATAGPLVLVLHLTGPQDGPGEDVGAILVAAVALIAISALIVPTIAAQVAWTWRREPARAEAAVLSRAVPGPRRTILVARTVAVTAWVLSITGAVVTSVLLVGEASQRLHAIAVSYSARDAASDVRDALLDRYVVGDIRCPASLPDPGVQTVFSCRVTSLDRTASIEAQWFPGGFGTGDVTVTDPEHAPLTRVADLPGPVPTAVALAEDVTAAALTSAVRTQLIDEGWSRGSAAVGQLSCPSVGRDVGSDADAGFVRCTIGQDPRTQRYLDVYPVADGRFTARTAEIADLAR